MGGIICFEVPTPENNSIHDCEADATASEPYNQYSDERLPAHLGAEQPLA
jgi:hypothetical protein